jgi:hypothetical protein
MITKNGTKTMIEFEISNEDKLSLTEVKLDLLQSLLDVHDRGVSTSYIMP